MENRLSVLDDSCIPSLFKVYDTENELEQNEVSEVKIKNMTFIVRIAEDDFNIEKKTLFATHIWNGAKILSTYLVDNVMDRIRGNTVLELGAGVGIPSMTCHLLSASFVCASDYPSNSVINNLTQNIKTNCIHSKANKTDILVVPYAWGNPPNELLSINQGTTYDIVIASECLWHHSQHECLIQSVKSVIRVGGWLILSFSHHIPGLEASDLGFFELATAAGFEVMKVSTVPSTTMWSEKPTDIFIYELIYKAV